MSVPIGSWVASLVLDIAAYAVNFSWRGLVDCNGDAVAAGPLTLSLVSLLALGASGYLGGKLAYRYGVRVAAESVQAEG